MWNVWIPAVALLALCACGRSAVERNGGIAKMSAAPEDGHADRGRSDGERPSAGAGDGEHGNSGAGGEAGGRLKVYSIAAGGLVETERVVRSDEEWKRALDPMEYEVMRRKGTERAFTGKYWDHHEAGRYACAACGNDLFLSETKYDSGCGWPSFYAPVDAANVELAPDHSHGMVRTEVTCRRCGAHLGHLFDDGPAPTGQRYCMNSVSLEFAPAGDKPPAADAAAAPSPPGSDGEAR